MKYLKLFKENKSYSEIPYEEYRVIAQQKFKNLQKEKFRDIEIEKINVIMPTDYYIAIINCVPEKTALHLIYDRKLVGEIIKFEDEWFIVMLYKTQNPNFIHHPEGKKMKKSGTFACDGINSVIDLLDDYFNDEIT